MSKGSKGGGKGSKGGKPKNRTTTQCTFTEPQKAFVGSPPQAKILGQKQPIDHSGDSSILYTRF